MPLGMLASAACAPCVLSAVHKASSLCCMDGCAALSNAVARAAAEFRFATRRSCTSATRGGGHARWLERASSGTPNKPSWLSRTGCAIVFFVCSRLASSVVPRKPEDLPCCLPCRPANLRWAVRRGGAGSTSGSPDRRSGPSYRKHGGSVAPRFSSARRSASSSFSSSRFDSRGEIWGICARRCKSGRKADESPCFSHVAQRFSDAANGISRHRVGVPARVRSLCHLWLIAGGGAACVHLARCRFAEQQACQQQSQCA